MVLQDEMEDDRADVWSIEEEEPNRKGSRANSLEGWGKVEVEDAKILRSLSSPCLRNCMSSCKQGEVTIVSKEGLCFLRVAFIRTIYVATMETLL